MSCNPILSGFARSIESHSGDYGSLFSFQRHQSGATNRRYDIMQQTQAVTGFGFGLLCVPVFLWVIDSIAAIQIITIVTLIMSLVILPSV